MSTSSAGKALVVTGVCVAALLGVAASFSRICPRHFLPEQELTAAVAAGDGCFLFLGDSRMAAGFQPGAMHAALAGLGNDRCLANLAIGATDVSGAFLAARTYLSRGVRPAMVVLGSVADFPLGPAAPLTPEEMVGNNAIHLIWSRADDVFAEVPGFWSGGIVPFDRGFRFLALRATPFGRYQSLFARKLQTFDARLAGATPAERNRFGALDNMVSLEAHLRTGAVDRLAAALRSPNERRVSPWFRALRELVGAAGIPFVVVELPMPSRFRQAVVETEVGRAYRQWLRSDLEAGGGALIDLSHPAWLSDQLFDDGLHLGARGATKLSESLGLQLAALSKRPAP
jgi:hypothetical protein